MFLNIEGGIQGVNQKGYTSVGTISWRKVGHIIIL